MNHDLSDDIIGQKITGYCINNDGSIEIFLKNGDSIYIGED